MRSVLGRRGGGGGGRGDERWRVDRMGKGWDMGGLESDMLMIEETFRESVAF